MFQREFKALSGNKFLFKRRGQVSLLFALMMPIFILMVGVTLDLGWYYLNVSRLQNAADAAAVAGAKTLVSNGGFTDYKNIKLIDKYPGKVSNEYRATDVDELTAIEKGNSVAEEYVAKNLSSNKDTIINSWTKSEVDSEEGLYTKDDNLYYVVKLKEEVRHFFLSGWFDDMTAPVTAVALLSKTAIKGDSQSSDHKMPDTPTPPLVDDLIENVVLDEELIKEIETVKNENAIVGNWEVQKCYKSLTSNSNDTYIDYSQNPNGVVKSYTLADSFRQRYTFDVYTSKWNHFQDMKNHYNVAGATYRTETINVWDDVVDTDNDGYADKWRTTSSVANTTASINKDNKPYLWYQLDSINVDFKPEITFSVVTNEDWDFKLGYLTTSCHHQGNDYKDWTAQQGTDVKNIGILRIHSTINIGAPYKDRNYNEALPDILWGRIESEPMLFYPDEVNGYTTSNRGVVKGLSSVRQIIINVKESNYNDGDTMYRPVVLFYDGPEKYDNPKGTRDSLPVILNLNAKFRGVLYAPNSPVVVIGNRKDNFDGFVVAKEYKRLKTTADFEDEVKADSGKYTRYNDDFTTNAEVDNPYYVADESNYHSSYKAEPKKIKWKYTKITENGIEMYVDNYGNVQYMDYPDAPPRYGDYDNFGRTAFTTHGYKVLKSSANNMLLSGR